MPFTYASSPSESLEQATSERKKASSPPPNALMNSINEVLRLNLKLINAKDNFISNADMLGSIFSGLGVMGSGSNRFISPPKRAKTPYKDVHAQGL